MHRVTWTPEMLEALRSLRARGVALIDCARLIGVGYPTAVYKARELGLAGKISRGRQSGQEVMARQ